MSNGSELPELFLQVTELPKENGMISEKEAETLFASSEEAYGEAHAPTAQLKAIAAIRGKASSLFLIFDIPFHLKFIRL